MSREPAKNVNKMDTDEKELRQLLDFAVDLARAAGQITLNYFRQSFETATKSDGSFVTVADCEAETFLRGTIAERFPQDAILGEEGGAQEGTSDRRWILDPIDGTFSFVHGVPFYGVLIALEIAGQPTIGVINLPALGELIHAAHGLGCFWNGAPARVSSTAKLEDALLLATDFRACAAQGFGAAAEELQLRAKESRTWGDCYGHALVATGRADIMLDPVMKVWDCAALQPIIQEAGGTFTDWGGARTIRGGNAISTNSVLFEEVMKTVN